MSCPLTFPEPLPGTCLPVLGSPRMSLSLPTAYNGVEIHHQPAYHSFLQEKRSPYNQSCQGGDHADHTLVPGMGT